MAGICTIPDCPKPILARGWCQRHYWRAYRNNGDPLAPTRDRASNGEPLAYFWAHVDDVTNLCIIWPYAAGGDGYGGVTYNGRYRLVHVLACEHHYGPMPEPGMLAIHRPVICHNRKCFNWRHLRWGSNAENMQDKFLDETNPVGERNPYAKLTWDAVTDIRVRWAAGGITQTALAAEYGVSTSSISFIVTGQQWKEDRRPTGQSDSFEKGMLW